MAAENPLSQMKIWFDKPKYDMAEKKYYERLAKQQKGNPPNPAPNPVPNNASKEPKPKDIPTKKDSPPKIEQPKAPAKNQAGGNAPGKPPANAQPKNKSDTKADVGKPVDKANPVPNPVIPTDPSNPELTVKKESKKTKKNKKERHRNNKEREEKGAPTQNGNSLNSLAGEVAKARQHIKNSLQCIDDIANMTSPSAVVEVTNRLNSIEKENVDLRLKVGELTALLSKLEVRVKDLEKGAGSSSHVGLQAVAPISTVGSQAVANVKTAQSQAKPVQKDDDDDVDLFGSSDEEDAEAEKLKEQRLAEYAAKKSKKPALIAKSSIILDVKPWDDETDMKEMEKKVREIKADGLLWGASKLVPLAYGIHKLQINSVVEDEKISVDWLTETIEGIEDLVQSVDIAAFNKI